jgi:hypothetical protein
MRESNLCSAGVQALRLRRSFVQKGCFSENAASLPTRLSLAWRCFVDVSLQTIASSSWRFRYPAISRSGCEACRFTRRSKYSGTGV